MYLKSVFVLVFMALHSYINGQSISGVVVSEGEPIAYANIALYAQSDSTLIKVETSDEEGVFSFSNIEAGSCYLSISYVGYEDYLSDYMEVGSQDIDLGILELSTGGIELETAVVTALRPMVEVKADRTVFNVQGTINSTGDNGLNLLRKAPGILVDNNKNISVLGRSGVLVFIDGKRFPLTGDDLTAYLENLSAEQIDKIDIITNPGARYEAQGNAGIIDIRLKKDKSLGTNGSVTGTYSQGRKHKSNVNLSANHRNKKFNLFGTAGYNDNVGNEIFYFDGYQNNFRLLNRTEMVNKRKGLDLRFGMDFFLNDKHTVGFLVNTNNGNEDLALFNQNVISSVTQVDNYDTTPDDVEIPYQDIDSVLRAENLTLTDRISRTINLNYIFKTASGQLNIDLDHGQYDIENIQDQPNNYVDRDEVALRSTEFSFITPRKIDINTAKVDYETNLAGGKFGIGSKLSVVNTENTFLFFDGLGQDTIRNLSKSNIFDYEEQVLAGYLSYARNLSQKINMSLGIRVEHTDAEGVLTAFKDDLNEDPVELNYVSAFPSAGLTYQPTMGNTWSLAYGRRINRPDYNVLNPFRVQLSELDFSNGNPMLRPEIVNNFEIGYTLKFRFNFKLAYSVTEDKITRLIGTDESDPKASFINWDNLAEQRVLSLNASLPLQLKPWWSAFINLTGNRTQNLAEYEDDSIDVTAWGYNVFQQHSLTLGKGFVGEVSGWYSGPGIWGGVFKYENSWALNLGLQKKFLADKLSVRLSFNDIFNQAFWSGYSDFDGLLSYGTGNWDNRRVGLSVGYNFGRSEIKASRKRKTGLEDESKRVGSD